MCGGAQHLEHVHGQSGTKCVVLGTCGNEYIMGS